MSVVTPGLINPYEGVVRQNIEPDFDALLKGQLKNYVYALGGPEPESIFYIGKAGGKKDAGNQRVLDHFIEAEQVIRGTRSPKPKHKRIIEEWRQGRPVLWSILRYGLKPEEAHHAEGSLIDAFGLRQLTNKRREKNKAHGRLSIQDLQDMAAPHVAPANEYPLVLLFPIGNTIGAAPSVYEATRRAWTIGPPFRNRGVVAVGVADGISRGVFSVESWASLGGGKKREFTGSDLPGHELLGRLFTSVIAHAPVYWSRGNFLGIELRPNAFRFERGHDNRHAWHPLPAVPPAP